MKVEIWLRNRTVINTDPQRRCYDGCNFSERVELGEWQLFQTWEGMKFAERVARGLRCERFNIKLVPKKE